MNVVALTGRLASDVAHRNVDGHGAVAEFRVAVDGRSPIYLTVQTWGHSAGKAASHLTKGRRIAITGRWAQREFLDRSNQRRQVDYVIAHGLTYLDSPRRNGPGDDDTALSDDQDRAPQTNGSVRVAD